ncbi:PAS domain-containing sensor histidine kinase [Aquimarina sediminis]|uniref:PAS domain-containing sensor histidine kinase n=1 Tax=Aquimarina sediminis TaxID=2070536 RepID=UPI000CA07F30|nr:PAS domain S-box protein [Aquimarina sediminis]
MDNESIYILKRALQRERAARKQAEKILEDKSRELYQRTQELKESNEKLEDLVDKKEVKLQKVFDNLLDAYVQMDIFGNVIEMNHAAKKLFGYDISKEKLNVVKLIYKEDYKYAIKSFQELMTKGSFSDYRARVYTKNNGVRTVHINASLLFDKNKTPLGAQGIVTDITEELERKRIFEEQKQKLSVIVENSSLGIVLTQFGKIVQTNNAFQKLLGYTQEELLKKEIRDISIKDEYDSVASKIEKINTGEIDNFSINKRYLKRNGSSFWAKTNVAAVRNPIGDIQYQVSFIEDITAQLELEEQREQLVTNLEKTNQELKDYAHIVSHDLKSPLRSINALVNWIKEDHVDVLDKEGVHHFNMIEKTLEKMEDLINDILSYSSVSNMENLESKKIDLNTLVSEIMNILLIPENMTITIKNELPTIKGDSTRIQQLFQNLIGNALIYNDKEKGIIEIDYEDKKTHYLFSIKDNGVGVKKEHYDKIFKMFQSVGDNENSSGVGLAIVKKIIDLYEGEIWIESTTGKGTTFFFTLKK